VFEGAIPNLSLLVKIYGSKESVEIYSLPWKSRTTFEGSANRVLSSAVTTSELAQNCRNVAPISLSTTNLLGAK